MLTPREFTSSLLLKASWEQGQHFGGLACMKMIAQCIGNRVRTGWGDWHTVLAQLPTYSALKVIPNETLPATNDPRFVQMLSIADQVYNNSGEDLAKGGLFWVDLRWLNTENSNPWFKEHVVENTDYKQVSQNSLLVLWG